MKKLINALTGKKAMIGCLAVVTVCEVMEVITAVRLGTKIDFATAGVLYSVLTVWAACLTVKTNKKEEI